LEVSPKPNIREAVFRNRPSLQELEQCSFRQRQTFMRVLQIMKQSRSQEKKDGIYDRTPQRLYNLNQIVLIPQNQLFFLEE